MKMRKLRPILTVILSLALLFALAGCAGTRPEEGATPPASETETPSESPAPETPETPEAGVEEDELTALISAIYAQKNVEIPLMTLPLNLSDLENLKYNTGLSDATHLVSGAVSEAMIGSQAYSLVLLRVEDAAHAETVAQAMKEGIDPRKWICVEADDLRIAGEADLVLLIMVDSTLAEVTTAQEILDAFEDVLESPLDFTL